MTKQKAILLLSLLTCTVQGKTQSVDATAITPQIQLLRLNSTMGNTSSVVFVGQDGVLLIDPNFDGSFDLIQDKLKALGANKVNYVTSTHVHRDHTEQYPAFLNNAIGIVPDSQRQALSNEAYMKGLLPGVTYQNSLTLYLNGDIVHLSTLPNKRGHTNGDEIVYFEKAGVLYVGDYLFVDRYPVIDKTLGNLDGYLGNIRHMLDHYPEKTKILAGHTTFDEQPFGPVSMSQYRQYYDDLQASVETIRKRLNKGQSVEQIIAEGLPKRFARYNAKPSFVSEKRWITYVADSLKHKQAAD